MRTIFQNLRIDVSAPLVLISCLLGWTAPLMAYPGQYELIGVIQGSSGYAGGKKDVAVLRDKVKNKTVVVAKGTLVPGSGGYELVSIRNGEAVLRTKTGQTMALAKDPFPSNTGSGSRGDAESGMIADSSSEWSDDSGYDSGFVDAGGYDPTTVRTYEGPGTYAARSEVDPTGHYSIPRGEESDFIAAREMANSMVQNRDAAGMPVGIEAGNVFQNPVVNSEVSGISGVEGFVPPVDPNQNPNADMQIRTQPNSERYSAGSAFQRFRNYQQRNGGLSRPPIIRQ